MTFSKNSYLKLLKNHDFLLLFLTTFLGQVATAFLIISMIVSVYARTESSYAVSGVILSFTIPGFFLMAFAGIAADVFDRRKIIFLSNVFITIAVFLILFLKGRVFETTLLTSLYFAGNTMYLPAAQAATGQIAGKRRVLVSNVYFVFTFSGGFIIGLFLASVVHFFWGVDLALWLCFCLLATAAVTAYFLPNMRPSKQKKFSFVATLRDVGETFVYIFRRKLLWFYFLSFAFSQGVIGFAATIAPGFFQEILGLGFDKALIVVIPLVGVGNVFGAYLVHKIRRKEHFFIILGMFVLSVSFLALGSVVTFGITERIIYYFVCAIFLISIGMADLIIFIASRVAIQKTVDHNYQGTVFGASILLTSVMATFFSLIAARTVGTLGYVSTLYLGGVGMLVATVGVAFLVWKWLYART